MTLKEKLLHIALPAVLGAALFGAYAFGFRTGRTGDRLDDKFRDVQTVPNWDIKVLTQADKKQIADLKAFVFEHGRDTCYAFIQSFADNPSSHIPIVSCVRDPW